MKKKPATPRKNLRLFQAWIDPKIWEAADTKRRKARVHWRTLVEQFLKTLELK
jgi:hypothetical protein